MQPQLQRTPDWRLSRRGKITASRMGDVLANPTSKRFRGYALEVAYGILGVDGFDLDQPWFQHGREWEATAKALYEWSTGRTVVDVGFIPHPTLPYVGASPDGLVDDGCLEIKSRISFDAHIDSSTQVPAVYRPQVQAEMWVTGSSWNDFVSYWQNPNDSMHRAITVVRAYRDDDLIRKMERQCGELWGLALQLAEQLQRTRRL